MFLWKHIFILIFLVAYNSRQWNSKKSLNYCSFGSSSQDRFIFNSLFKGWYEDETHTNSFKLIFFMINNICNMHYKVRKWDKIHHVLQQLRFCIIRWIININILHVVCGNAIWGWFDGWYNFILSFHPIKCGCHRKCHYPTMVVIKLVEVKL